jgi:hypothetical protein
VAPIFERCVEAFAGSGLSIEDGGRTLPPYPENDKNDPLINTIARTDTLNPNLNTIGIEAEAVLL